MRLRLDIEYDGTDFAGWAAQPGCARVEGTLREALAGLFAGVRQPRRRRPYRCGRPRARAGGERRRRGRPAGRNAAEALNTVLPDDLAVIAAERGRATTSTRGGRRRRALPIPDLPPPDAVAVRASPQLVVPAPDRRGQTRRGGGRDPGRARLPRVHADGDPAPRLRARGQGRCVAPARRRARARDHRGQLPAAHGAHARRDDGRAEPEEIARLVEGRPTVARRARPRRRGASTSSRSSTDVFARQNIRQRSRLRKKPWPLRFRHVRPVVAEAQLIAPKRIVVP